MDRNQLVYRTYVDILRRELICAMGCTEPIALAYCAATARVVLGCLPDRIDVEASGNIIKNVKSVVVPNTGGRLPETETHSGGGPLWHSAFFIRLTRCMTETAGC